MLVRACDVAVVGGGPGGLYSAWRLENSTALASICVYEAAAHFGGRIATVHEEGLTAEAGAYRYARHLTLDNQDTTCV